eukprot:TRINITY_DN16587_c0_g2_i1.p1 TRINITY_DN16587_c0_g2~~TRINITY_DN16587_c0_g2_i1.p1  ORF type:complete len:672 (+),score=157.26 TRINITY_DN16587_c0_g2_i1:198-2213(+)
MAVPVKLRIAGAWSGEVEVANLDTWTVRDLRCDIARKCGVQPSSLKLLAAGKTLKDHSENVTKIDSIKPTGKEPMTAGERPECIRGSLPENSSQAPPRSINLTDKSFAAGPRTNENTEEEASQAIGDAPMVIDRTTSSLCSMPGGTSPGANLKQSKRAPSLRELGLTVNSKVLVTRVAPSELEQLQAANEKSKSLDRLRAAAESLAKRSGEGSSGAMDVELENQDGTQLAFESEADRRAIVLGLVFHAKGRALLEKQAAQTGEAAREGFGEALEVLQMAAEAFELCNRKLLEAVDNVAMLQLDMVWCLFMRQEEEQLALARQRLREAREGLQKSHGPNLERLRVLQGHFAPELATYVRLELLEGVVAFYAGDFKAARKSLTSAKEKFGKLQVSDDAVVQLAGMGFSAKDATRALRVSGQDIGSAVDFLMEQKQKRMERKEADERRRAEQKEQAKYGKTASGKRVDLQKLKKIQGLGYDVFVAAEALRQRDNDFDGALEVLLDEEASAALHVAVMSKTRKKAKIHLPAEAKALLDSMGFGEQQVRRALEASGSHLEAIDRLLKDGVANAADIASGASSSSNNIPAAGATQAPAASSAQGAPIAEMQRTCGACDDNTNSSDEEMEEGEQRDVEMEDEIRGNVKGDAYAEYDVDVEKEGEAINEYLARLNEVDG